MKITIDMLKSEGACIDMKLTFIALFEQETEVTVELCERYYLNFATAWNWIAFRFLTKENFAEYCLAIREKQMAYGNKDIPLVWDEYELLKARTFARLFN